MKENGNRGGIDAEDRSRAVFYDFLAALLTKPPDSVLLKNVANLESDSSDLLGKSINAMSRLASSSTAASVEREFNALFIGVGRGELLPYCSYYLTGFLNEKPLAEIRRDMARLSIMRTPGHMEPEDHIASVLEMMAGLIAGRYGDPAGLEVQKEFFDKHVGVWAEHFFSDLEAAKNSVFYAPVGSAGKAFIEVEKESFKLAEGELRR